MRSAIGCAPCGRFASAAAIKRFRNGKYGILAAIKLSVSKQDFQFRDLRAKAGTDKEERYGMEAAKDQLGHSDEKMMQRYVRHRKGKLVTPTR